MANVWRWYTTEYLSALKRRQLLIHTQGGRVSNMCKRSQAHRYTLRERGGTANAHGVSFGVRKTFWNWTEVGLHKTVNVLHALTLHFKMVHLTSILKVRAYKYVV